MTACVFVQYTACEMAESGSVTFIQQPTQWIQGVLQQSVDPNGEPIVYKARCLVQQFEDALFRSYSTNVCLLTGLIGVLVSWSQHRRRSREVAASWQLYVTDRSFVYTIVDSGHPSTIRIPLAHIEAVSVNEPLAECGPATCLCSTGPDAVVVTLKRGNIVHSMERGVAADWLFATQKTRTNSRMPSDARCRLEATESCKPTGLHHFNSN